MEEPEFDEDGRRYVFRFARQSPPHYSIDRDRLFLYCKTHQLPSMRQRSRLRDERNAADFFEDVRDIQTHADVEIIVQRPDELKQRRLRSA